MRRRLHKIRGQISILIIFSLIPMFTLFAFVVNVGMLVQAKISLQNAADFAAYAGAATQARQMTHISHLNYMLREAYKKFLFRYYVMGNISLKCFPGNGNNCAGASGEFSWINPGGNAFPGVPSVCISLSTTSNPCQLAKPVPIVQPPPCIPLDPTCAALQNAANAISAIQQTSCTANSIINEEVLAQWLYATDKNSPLQSNVNLQGLIDDFGLVTENMLTYHRIQTVLSYINAQPQVHITAALETSKLENDPEPPKVERTILAFKSALKNLNSAVFDAETAELTELLPSGGPGLTLTSIKPTIDATYALMDGSNPSVGCSMVLQKFQAAPYLGVYRAPGPPVYYAVKVTAKAQLLFNPFPFGNPDDRVELTAYSAAMPFGSRIGPQLQESDFYKAGPAFGLTTVNYPYLKVTDNVSWADVTVLSAYHNLLSHATNGGGSVATGAVGKSDLERGLHGAVLPEQFEVGKYNIPVDTERINTTARTNYDGSTESFESNAYYRHSVEGGSTVPVDYTFWAPLMPPQGKDAFTAAMQTEIEMVSAWATQSGVNSSSQNAAAALKSELLANLGQTLGTLQTTNNYNIARMPDPLSQVFFKAFPPAPAIPGKITNPVQLATSFTTDHDYTYYQNGRDGYSVKFIPFKMLLTSPGRLMNLQGETKWTPVSDNLSGERNELVKVAH